MQTMTNPAKRLPKRRRFRKTSVKIKINNVELSDSKRYDVNYVNESYICNVSEAGQRHERKDDDQYCVDADRPDTAAMAINNNMTSSVIIIIISSSSSNITRYV